MIVVDTSIWIAVLRSRTAPEAAVLAQLLDADSVILPVPVRLELLLGAGAGDRARLRSVLSALPVAYPDDDTWKLVEQWADQVTGRGQRFGVGDLRPDAGQDRRGIHHIADVRCGGLRGRIE